MSAISFKGQNIAYLENSNSFCIVHVFNCKIIDFSSKVQIELHNVIKKLITKLLLYYKFFNEQDKSYQWYFY